MKQEGSRKYLHPYWRMPYILRQKGQEASNPFEGLRQADDEKHLVVWRGRDSCVILNKYPYTGGHLLVVPYRVVTDISDLEEGERAEFFEAIVEAKCLLQKAMRPDAFNIGFNIGKQAGGSVETHLHCHVVPRWRGDVNFLPIMADTHILPMALEDVWKHLKATGGEGEK